MYNDVYYDVYYYAYYGAILLCAQELQPEKNI